MSISIHIAETADALGRQAAEEIAALLHQAIKTQGEARIILSTGASQFTTLAALVTMDIPWEKVEMFHLDEYISLPDTHPASFRKYLKERFISQVPLKAYHLVDGEGDVKANIASLTAELRKKPIDVGVIGIGENGHIAFNDPPADFETEEAYLIVELDEKCRNQQVGEGWFATAEDVPKQAVSMSVHQIMQCKHIISAVPYSVKADAIKNTLSNALTNTVPATILKTHADWHLFLDKDSAQKAFKL